MPVRCRGLHRALTILLVLMLVLVSRAAFAQSLPDTLLKATTPLTDSQKKAIQDHVAPLLHQLVTADTNRIVVARAQLLAPLATKGLTDNFTSTYTQVLLPSLSKALTNNRLIVRLNAMIVLSHLPVGSNNDQIIASCGQALKDKSPAVRYWGAKTLENLAKSTDPAPTEDQLGKMRQLLAGEVSGEQSAPVLRQIFLAMASMTGPGENQMLFKALDSRLSYHLAHPQATFMAERAAMQAVYVQLVQAVANGKTVTDQLKTLAGVAVRYYALAAQQLVGDKSKGSTPLTAAAREDCQATATFCDRVLRFALKTLGDTSDAPPPIAGIMSTQNWTALDQVVTAWQSDLQKQPFGLSREQVTLAKNS